MAEHCSRRAAVPITAPSATDFTIGHNVACKAEVDEVMEQARGAGAVIVKPAQDTFWGGYSGYFQDPDEHLWEVAVNPQLGSRERGVTSARSLISRR